MLMGAMTGDEDERCREKVASRAVAVLEEAAVARERLARASIRCCLGRYSEAIPEGKETMAEAGEALTPLYKVRSISGTVADQATSSDRGEE